MGTVKIWHDAFAIGKVCCPHERCWENTAFFQKACIEQHCRSFHQQFEESTIKEAEDLFKLRHREEVFKELSRVYGHSTSEVLHSLYNYKIPQSLSKLQTTNVH